MEFLDAQLESDAPFSLNVHYTAPHAPWGRENHPAEIFDAHYENTAFDSVPEEDIHINQLAKEGSSRAPSATLPRTAGCRSAATSLR